MKLLLVRHGESEGNAEDRFQGQADYPLSDLGREQARRLAKRLTEEFQGIAALYTSPLSRAAETAAILAEQLGVRAVRDERLKEYYVGELTGLTAAEVKERYPQVFAAWIGAEQGWVCPPGGESNEALRQRVRACYDEIIARHQDDGAVVVVSHGGALGAYICEIAGLPSGRRHPFVFSNASLSIVDLSRRRPRLMRLNDTHHLAGLDGM